MKLEHLSFLLMYLPHLYTHLYTHTCAKIITAAYEYGEMSIRHKEESQLKRIATHLPHQLPQNASYEDPSTKALVLLQAHFCRYALPSDLIRDVGLILKDAVKLIQVHTQ